MFHNVLLDFIYHYNLIFAEHIQIFNATMSSDLYIP